MFHIDFDLRVVQGYFRDEELDRLRDLTDLGARLKWHRKQQRETGVRGKENIKDGGRAGSVRKSTKTCAVCWSSTC